MRQGAPGHVKDLLLLISLFLLAILFVSAVIVSAVFGIPLQNIDIRDGKATNLNDFQDQTIDPNNNDTCSVLFLPPRWGVSMHIIMYVWTAVAIGFLISNVFRMSRDGKTYCSPAIFNLTACSAASLSFLFYITWMILWAESYWTASACLIFLAMISSWASLVIFSINLYTHTEYLYHYGSVDLWLYRISVQNALGMMAGWFLCLTLVNFSTALGSGNVGEPTGSEISIIILTFLIAIYTPFDMMLLDKLFRYMLSPLIVILWTLSSIYNRLRGDYCYDVTVRVYSLVLIGIVVVILVGRIILTTFRHLRKPLAKNQ